MAKILRIRDIRIKRPRRILGLSPWGPAWGSNVIVWSKARIVIVFILTVIFGCAGVDTVIAGQQGGWAIVLFATALAIVFIVSLSAAKPRTDVLRTQITQYPNPIKLTGRRGRSLFLALASSMMALVNLFGLLSFPAMVGSVIFHSVLLTVFGVSALILTAATIRPSRLTMDKEGLTLKNIFRIRRWEWRDIKEFRPISAVTYGKRIVKMKDAIGFDDRNAKKTARANRQKKLLGTSASFPNQFGPSDDELAFSLNAWRLRAISDGDRG
ncbi:PH (Pleckstrin Homology) domain-containing protein [Rhizobium sp. PP-WC-1G-195]|nr:PH (Pleckstrin Homology) domain-containing protein [Rhizobium sp. PP-WC-1G-195]